MKWLSGSSAFPDPLLFGFVGIGIYGVAHILYFAVSSFWRVQGHRALLGFFGGITMAYGCGAFFSCMVSSGINFPSAFEWPAGHADQLIQIPDGRRVAVLIVCSRIQVYDRDWRFVRSWLVNASGKDFKARLLPDSKLEVWTAVGAHHYVFTLDGAEVESSSYAKGDFMRLPVTAGPGYVPTPLLLLPFSDPFIAWAVGMCGGCLLLYSDPQRFSRRDKTLGRRRSPTVIGVLVFGAWCLCLFVFIPACHRRHQLDATSTAIPSPSPELSATPTPAPNAALQPMPRYSFILKGPVAVRTQFGMVTIPANTEVGILTESGDKERVSASGIEFDVPRVQIVRVQQQ